MLTFIEMSLELVELALSEANVEVDHRVGRCGADVGPFIWDIVRVFDLVGCPSPYRRCEDRACGKQGCQ